MAQTFREIFDQDCIDILIKALTLYSNRCKTNATRKMQGYGTARELCKRDNWMDEHKNTEIVLGLVVQESC